MASERRARPERLPGLGTRYPFTDVEGQSFSVIVRDDGVTELYVGEGVGCAVLRFSGGLGRSVGALLAGHLAVEPELVDRIGDVIGRLELDWVRVPKGAAAVGRSIALLEVRKRTGVTIVAILRGSTAVASPDPDVRLDAGDELVVVSPADALDEFRTFVERPA